jgi:hypothetical protein
MTPEARNILNYALLAVGAFAVGCATALVPQLMDPSMPPLNLRVVLGTGITALITAYGGSLLPRFGSEHIAQQVNSLREMGYHRDDLAVVPRGGRAPDPGATAGSPVVLTPDQVKQVADELEARMRATPAESDPLISKPPAWLPGEGPGR